LNKKKARAISALMSVVDETRLLFHRMKVVADQIHHREDISAGMRGVLMSLDNLGPQSVPQMARARPVSRQHIQILVNSLLEEGRVELVDNPAHKRSNLVRLTRSGKRLVGAMERREVQLLGQLGIDVAVSDLENAAEVLRAARRMFEGERWQHLVGDTRASQRQTSLHSE
jgi:DNA-binding MarR family transcriptional regulator